MEFSKAFLLLPLVLGSSNAQQPTYIIQDLGAGQAYAINSFGHVTGSQESRNGCFIYDGTSSKLVSSSSLGNYSCVSINDSDTVVGTAQSGSSARAFTYDPRSGFTQIGTLGGGFSLAAGINNSGVIVGTSTVSGSPPDSNGLERAFLYKDGKLAALSGLGSAYSQAVSINTSGQIVGTAQIGTAVRAFVYDGGTITQLAPPTGFVSLGVSGISDSGRLVGSALASSGPDRAFLYVAGGIALIPPLAVGAFNQAHGVNLQGDVVGVSGTASASVSFSRHAFLFSGGQVYDLNKAIGSSDASVWVLEDATAINAKGQIAGYGSLRGQPRAFLLTPGTPTTSTQPTPHIGAVVSAADFQPGIAPGGFATIFGSNLSDGIYQAASISYPTSLGHTQVAFCLPQAVAIQASECQYAQLVYASPTQINFLVPSVFASFGSPPIAPSVVLVSVNGIADDGASRNFGQNLGLSIPQPRIFVEGYDCFTDSRFQDASKNCGLTGTKGTTYQAVRGAVTDQQGRLLTSSNPARLGQYYTLWLTGLWLPLTLGTSGNSAMSMALTNNPEFRNGKFLPGDGNPARITPSYVGQSAQYPGLFQVNFQLGGVPQVDGPNYPAPYSGPNLLPCVQYNWEVSLSLIQGSGRANLVMIPIVVYPSDLGCLP